MPPEYQAYNVHTQHRIDDEPVPGYTTSVQIHNTQRGPLITFIGVGISPDERFEPDKEFPWYSEIPVVRTGISEAGVTARILKALNITAAKRGALEQLRADQAADGSGHLALDIAVEQLIEGLSGRTQKRDDKFKATLAAAYIAQVAETGSRGVYDELAKKLSYSPHTLRSYVKEIRDQGFLTPAVPGVAGGDVTDKTRSILGLTPLEGS
jgi:hypothetical protein